MAPKLQLVYFAVQAKGETARMILEFGGIPYEDLSCQQYFGTGWKEAKAMAPFGQLPMLVVDGSAPLAQSGSIVRYCASLVPGLVPTSPLEAARCDAIYEAGIELNPINPIVNVYRGEAFEEKKAEFFSSFPAKLANLARALGDGPFFFGAKPLYCDFGVYHHLDNARLTEPTCLDAHPTVLAFMAAVEATPGIKEYLAGRPKPIEIGTAPKLDGPAMRATA